MDGTTEISPSEAGTILTVDLEAIVANWQTLRMVCGDAECGAVVKADSRLGPQTAVAAAGAPPEPRA